MEQTNSINNQTLSVVVPCFNEEDVIDHLVVELTCLLNELGINWEVIMVDDGSTDSTLSKLIKAHSSNARFRVIVLSRNFGHQAAILAGINHAEGEFVALMDADMQDPPKLLVECVDKLRSGYDVVYAIRKSRAENRIKTGMYAAFYRFLRKISDVPIPLDSGDFCAMTKRVAKIIAQFPERAVFVRGLRAYTGFRQTGIEYDRPKRFAGNTKYTFSKLLKLAFDGLFGFSNLPLKAAIYLGFISLTLSFIGAIFAFVWKLAGWKIIGLSPSTAPGWTSVVCLVLFIGGLQFMILGVIGEYVGRVLTEIRRRPRWVVLDTIGLTTKQDLYY